MRLFYFQRGANDISVPCKLPDARKRSNRRSRKPPVRPHEPRVAAVSDFPGTAGRVYPPETQNRALRRCAGEREIRSKPSTAGSVERGNAANVGNAETGKIEGFWTPRRESRINGWRRNRRFSRSQQPAVRTVSRGCAGAAIGACLEEKTRGWRQKSRKRRRFKGFRRAASQIGGL